MTTRSVRSSTLRRAWLALAGSALLVAACGGPGGPTAAPRPASAPGTSPPPVMPSRVGPPPTTTGYFYGNVTLLDGRILHVRCAGTGTPTILLEGGGIDGPIDDFRQEFVHRLSRETTTCQYSRAGGKGSTPAARPRTAEAIVADAYEMLDQLRAMNVVAPPYLFVGDSLGGTIALGEVMTRPETAAGLAIIDTDFPPRSIQAGIDWCVGLGIPRSDCEAGVVGDEEAKGIEAGVAALVRPLPELPVAVITSTWLDPACSPVAECRRRVDAIARAMLRDWSQLGSNVTQTLMNVPHDELTVEGGDMVLVILDMLRALRAAS